MLTKQPTSTSIIEMIYSNLTLVKTSEVRKKEDYSMQEINYILYTKI